jgi:adenine deaminase
MLKTWPEAAGRLIDVATGRSPADLVVRRGRWVNVHSGEILAGTDVAIALGGSLMSGRMRATP